MTTTEALPTTVLVHLADALSVPDGGFSVTVRNWVDARAGFAVSVAPRLEQRFPGSVVHEDIERYVSEHAAMLTRPDALLGGWRNPDTGIAHLDVSIVVPGRCQAFALARSRGQLAIWDFARQVSVPVVGHGRDET